MSVAGAWALLRTQCPCSSSSWRKRARGWTAISMGIRQGQGQLSEQGVLQQTLGASGEYLGGVGGGGGCCRGCGCAGLNMRACVRACVRACACVCVRPCVHPGWTADLHPRTRCAPPLLLPLPVPPSFLSKSRGLHVRSRNSERGRGVRRAASPSRGRLTAQAPRCWAMAGEWQQPTVRG